MNTEIASYSPVKAAISALTLSYKGLVFEVATPKGMADAKAAYKDINQYSIKLEAARTQEKAESLAYGRFIDSEAKRISEQLDALRIPIKEQIETETKREQREKEEAMRLAAEKFKAEEQAKKDAEEAHMAAERAEIAKQREALEAEQREVRRKIEEAERAARLEREEADRQARLAQQARDEVARQKNAAEEARLKEERDRIDAEARALAEEKRKKQEADEAEQREIQRELMAVSDARGVLIMFRDSYGHRNEFKAIIDAIDGYFAEAI